MIAEDLGHVTPADIRLREAFDLAPMRIFQFGFGSEPDSADHLPHNYSRVCAAYTGNHDNDTLVGWFRHLRSGQRQRVQAYTGATDAAPQAGAIRALMASPSNAVLFPMQDVLGLDQRARMNTPGTLEGNWQWRVPPVKLARPARRLRRLAEEFGRTFPTRQTNVTTTHHKKPQ
jgi:4-alpha-glucanotransferase